MDILSPEGDVCELLFAQKRAQHACRLFLNHLKEHNGLTRAEFSRFAWDLQNRKVEKDFKYDRGSFYRMVRRTLLIVGLIAIEQRFIGPQPADLMPERRFHRDVVEKYVAVRQPITKRPPDGVNLPRLIWILCDKWNKEFEAP